MEKGVRVVAYLPQHACAMYAQRSECGVFFRVVMSYVTLDDWGRVGSSGWSQHHHRILQNSSFLQLPVEEEVETAGGKLRDPEV